MLDNSIDLVITDPPYGMHYHSGRYANGNPFNPIINDQIFDMEFNSKWLELCYKKSKSNSCILLFTSHQVLSRWISLIEKHWSIKNIIIWVKNNWTAGDLEGNFGNQYEIIIFGVKGKFKLNGYRYSNVLMHNRIQPNYHPTEKPLGLIQQLIKSVSKENDLILDPFMGSGTTAIACLKTNRNFIGFEISPNYYEISNKRIDSIKSQNKIRKISNISVV